MAASTAVIVIAVVLLLAVAAWLLWSIRRFGWRRTQDNLRSLPSSALEFLIQRTRATGGGYGAVEGGLGGRRTRGSSLLGPEGFITVSDTAHGWRISGLPASWTVVRAESESSSLQLQATCDANIETTYKRLSIAWDDVSWSSTTAESFGRSIADNLSSLVPGSSLVAAGPYEGAAPCQSGDRPFLITYRMPDSDGSVLELLNAVHTSTLGGRRRAYTVTFSCDARDAAGLARLAHSLLRSFSLGGGDRSTPDNRVTRMSSAASTGSSGSGADSHSSHTSSSHLGTGLSGLDAEDLAMVRAHVPVWERGKAAPSGSGSGSGAASAATDGSASVAIAVSSSPQGKGSGASTAAATPPRTPGTSAPDTWLQTPSDPTKVTWSTASIAEAGLSVRHPAAWLSSGLGHDESSGFSAVPAHAVRRWCLAHTCDRRESSFKQQSAVCVDVTPLLGLISTRVASNPGALEGAGSPGKLLLTYVAHRFRTELLEAEAAAAGRPPPAALAPIASEACVGPWVELFAQQWPPAVRVSHCVTASSSPALSVPRHTAIQESRSVGNSLLLKVAGWIRTAGSGVGGVSGMGGPSASSGFTGSSAGADRGPDASPRRHGSSYSSLSSLDVEGAPAEGLLIHTTSAVLIGLHEALVPGVVPQRRTAAPAPPQLAKRTFCHLVTVSFASEHFAAMEPIAKAVLQSLEVKSPAAAGAGAGASVGSSPTPAPTAAGAAASSTPRSATGKR